MDARFARFEQLFDRLAPQPEQPPARVIPPPEPAVTQSKKRAADQLIEEGSPSPKVSKSTKNNNSRAISHTASLDNHEPEQAQQPQTLARPARHSTQATPRHTSARFAEQPAPPPQCQQTGQLRAPLPQHPRFSQRDTGASDTWAAWSAAYECQDSTFRKPSLPTSAQDLPYDDAVDSQVRQLLATTVHNLGIGNNQPYNFPYKYILRGPEKIKAVINSVTHPEHLWGIFRIIHDPKTNSDVKPCLMVHVEQIVEDAREYDWDTGVRRWSEEVFSRISEGRLPNGWHSSDEIQRMRMILAQSKPLPAPLPARPYPQNQQRDGFNRRQPSQTQQQQEILRGGPPCPEYNSATGCTLKSGHIKDGKRLIHVCAFCLLNTSATNTHPEAHCRNKVRLTGQFHHFQYRAR